VNVRGIDLGTANVVVDGDARLEKTLMDFLPMRVNQNFGV
jgi:hypothetical protein